MKHHCKICNYGTDRKNDMERHLESSRHQNNIKERTKINKPKHKYTKDINRIPVIINNPQNEIVKINNKYNCGNCIGKFNSLEDIERHIKLECKPDIRYDNFYIIDENTSGVKLFPNNENHGEIYIIQTDFSLCNCYKIGITNNLMDRIKHYRTGCKYEPRLCYYFPCKNIKKADTLLKKTLIEFNIKREIYNGNLEVIKVLILNDLKIINNDNNTAAYKPDVKLNDVCECKACNTVFLMQVDLMMHQKICTGQVKRKYICKYCDNDYRSSNSLSKHIRKCPFQNNDTNNMICERDKKIKTLENDKTLLAEQLQVQNKQLDLQAKQSELLYKQIEILQNLLHEKK